ncbi:hypothetical protein [Kocuria rosea]|uniref:hypothetical protein n=1 Tax=Kocuria rosea TaxID=1275 RepID=UPI00203FE60E|nr:hypothetical protein [Kocuria rosea]MCM3687557.1 hypothetical protein [Kocuria rosea]
MSTPITVNMNSAALRELERQVRAAPVPAREARTRPAVPAGAVTSCTTARAPDRQDR